MPVGLAYDLVWVYQVFFSIRPPTVGYLKKIVFFQQSQFFTHFVPTYR